jgi:tRNA-specific 2-thiouridylase
MAGGADSSVAAALMLNSGYDCIGVTLKLYTSDDIVPVHRGCCSGTPTRGCCSLEDVNDARNVAFALNMPHYVLNFTEPFRDEVIRRFIDIYEKGGRLIPASTVTGTSNLNGFCTGPGSWILICW